MATQVSDMNGYVDNLQGAVKFRTDSKIKWYRTKLDKNVLGELMKTSDLHGLRQVICQLGLFIVTGLLAYGASQKVSTTNWFWSLPVLIACSFRAWYWRPIYGTGGSPRTLP